MLQLGEGVEIAAAVVTAWMVGQIGSSAGASMSRRCDGKLPHVL